MDWLRRPAAPLVVAATLLSAGCSASASSGLDELRALPEASLAPANAERLASGGGNAASGIDGPIPAETWTVLGANLSISAVEDFYARELASRGWESGGGESGISSTHETKARAWHRDGVILRLGFWKLEEWRLAHKVGLDYPTIFELRLIRDTGSTTSPAAGRELPQPTTTH